MPLDSTRMVVGPTTERAEAPVTLVKIVPSTPPEGYLDIDENGNIALISTAPEYEGQMLVQNLGANSSMYVAVNIPNQVGFVELTWAKVAPITGYIDSTTGEEWRSL